MTDEQRLGEPLWLLRQIQERLGRKHLDSNRRYTRVTAHQLRGAVRRLHFPQTKVQAHAAIGKT